MAFIQTCHKTLVQHKTVALLAKALLNQAKQSFWFVNFCIKKTPQKASLKSIIEDHQWTPICIVDQWAKTKCTNELLSVLIKTWLHGESLYVVEMWGCMCVFLNPGVQKIR